MKRTAPPAEAPVRATGAEMRPAVRERLHEAVLIELGESWPGEVDLEKVLAEAGISAAEFRAEYPDLEACAMAAYEGLTRRFDTVVRNACRDAAATLGRSTSSWPGRVRYGLEAVLAAIAANPRLARALALGFPALGSEAQRRHHAFVESFAPMLTEGRQLAEAAAELPRELETFALGAVDAIVFERIASGRADELPRMAPEILFSLLTPFLGPERATAEMEKAGFKG
jgi:hypothetical protein